MCSHSITPSFIASRRDLTAALTLGLLPGGVLLLAVLLPERLTWQWPIGVFFLLPLLLADSSVKRWLKATGKHEVFWWSAVFDPGYVNFLLHSRGLEARWLSALRSVIFVLGCIAWLAAFVMNVYP